MKRKFKNLLIIVLLFSVILSGCNKKENLEEPLPNSDLVCDSSITVNYDKIYQVMEGFGASGAWWAQDVGGWTNLNGDNIETREAIAQLLFDKVNGIGLNTYRYNLGATVTENESVYSDLWRKSVSFLCEDGSLDFTKDANAQWMLNRAVELGVDNVVLFCNSAPNTLTVNGLTHLSDANTVNLAPENYDEFADYCFDVAEHFIENGIPVKTISPINEPQWTWTGGQEGCHYELSEMIAIYKVFIEELKTRPVLSGVEISIAESGNWKGYTYDYIRGLMADSEISEYIDTFDAHSYGSNILNKMAIKNWLKENNYDLKLRNTEWTEMVSGRDATMESGLVMASTIYEDFEYLNVISWQYWIAVSRYGYHDGLIYVDSDAKTYELTKRLYCFGNYAKFIDEGATMVGTTVAGAELYNSTFINPDGELVIVINNLEKTSMAVDIFSTQANYRNLKVYVTDENHNLELIRDELNDGAVELNENSVTTIVLK